MLDEFRNRLCPPCPRRHPHIHYFAASTRPEASPHPILTHTFGFDSLSLPISRHKVRGDGQSRRISRYAERKVGLLNARNPPSERAEDGFIGYERFTDCAVLLLFGYEWFAECGESLLIGYVRFAERKVLLLIDGETPTERRALLLIRYETLADCKACLTQAVRALRRRRPCHPHHHLRSRRRRTWTCRC